MIKSALILAIVAAHFGRLAHGDGSVTFRNDVAFQTPGDRLVREASGIPLVGSNYFAQLYYGAVGANPSSLNPVTSLPARFRLPTHPLPGTWAGGNRTLAGYVTGQTVTLQVRVWDGTIADTYEAAAALNFAGTQHGVSAAFVYWIPEVGGSFDSYMEEFRGFTLVPEPSVALLGIVGIAGLYFARKRRE
jgi:hypothetical protein